MTPHRLWTLAVSLTLVGCAPTLVADPPGPGVPRISELEIAPSRLTAGCLAGMRFRVEDDDADVVRAVVVWTLDRQRQLGAGSSVVSFEGGPATGRDVDQVTLALTPKIWGRHQYSVQVQDAAGHRSNVLTGVVLADRPVLLLPRSCQSQ